jgi:hypothetical protein
VGKVVSVVKLERHILDALDVNVALELAFEEPKVAKILPRESSEVISFHLDPGFCAVINLRQIRGNLTVKTDDVKSKANISS